MEYPKILVAIPHHPTKNYCLKRALKRAEQIDYPNKEIVLRFDPREYGSMDAVKHQREFFREIALNRGFDYLYFMGVDTIPPRDVLKRLIAQKKDIVGGVYWGRHDASNGKPEGAVAWIHAVSQKDQAIMFKERNKLIEVDGMGMDCVLFSRRVLEKISWLDWEQNDDDYPFYDLAIGLGYKIFLDTNIQCKHYFSTEGYAYLGKTFDK